MRKIIVALPILLVCGGIARAQTEAPAQPAAKGGMMKEIRPACRADIKSLCSDVQPGGGRIAKCIRSHESDLSQPCRDAVTKFRQSRFSNGGGGDAPATAH